MPRAFRARWWRGFAFLMSGGNATPPCQFKRVPLQGHRASRSRGVPVNPIGVLTSAFLVGGLAACTGASAPAAVPATTAAATVNITGTVHVTGAANFATKTDKPADEPRDCWGRGGYNDLGPDSVVIVSDNAGVIIAKGHATGALWTGSPECVVSWSVAVPAGLDIYQLKVGDRDPMVVTSPEIQKPLDFTIGY